MRLLLSDVILQLNGFSTDTELPIHQDSIIPGIHGNDITDVCIKLSPRLIKTHSIYYKIGYGTYLFKRPKAIYVFRKPADAVLSLHHYIELSKNKESNVYSVPNSRDLNTACLRMVNSWYYHVESYVQAKKQKPENILLCSYESMHDNTLEVLKKLLSFLEIYADEEYLIKAVNHHRFSKHKERGFSSYQSNPNTAQRQKGKIDSAKTQLSTATLELIEEKTIALYNKAKSLQF
jgi:hypothetical protein